MNRYFFQEFKNSRLNSIQIKIASPRFIIKWGSRQLPNREIVGEVKTSQTMNYKSLKPENNGLFCEKIFGPVKDFQCACGKKYQNELVGFCPQCKIEFVSSRVRRHRLGYIKLLSPVIHIWYTRYISILLDLPMKCIDSLVYCTDEIILKKPIIYKKDESKNQLVVTKTLLNVNFLNFQQIHYSIYFQKNLINYLKSSKNSFFLTKRIKEKNIQETFGYLYYLVDSFYSISHYFQWDAQKQWSIIAWYLKYSKKIRKALPAKTIFTSKFITESSAILDDKLFFGTRIIYSWLKFFDYNFQLPNLERQMRFYLFEIKEEIKELSGVVSIDIFKTGYLIHFKRRIKRLQSQRNKVFRRLRLIAYFRQAKIQPKWMILSVLPVLPPDLRPIVELGSNKIAISDLNKSYQTIILRNIRLNKFLTHQSLNDLTEEIRYTKRLLQESVDELIQKDKSKRADNNRSKSLSDILKGKKGRFRQNLLGKRVDYSGRSVIVVDPKLKLHECGIPIKMVIELFYPFIIQQLLYSKTVNTIPKARKLINQCAADVVNILPLLLKNHLLLLNRAPTLHKLGIQAFQPKLIKGKAIRLHPLVCPAFNADFDGDQMGIHIPLSFEARAESWKLLWSRSNLLFASTGTPVLTPGQDMVLGCYYLTSEINEGLNNLYIASKTLIINQIKTFYFSNVEDVLKAYHQHQLSIHSKIWIKWENFIINEIDLSSLNEIKIYSNGYFSFQYSDAQIFYNIKGFKLSQFIYTTVGRVLFNNSIKIISS